MDNKTSRREFCAHALTFVTVASLVEGCGGSPTAPGGGGSNAPRMPTISASVSGGTITLTIDGNSALNSVGNAALVQTGQSSFLVARTGQDSFSALTALCTHEQCVIDRFQSGTFGCPCHGSEYTTTGNVTKGPATQSLRQFNTQFTNNVLTITV